MSDHSEDPLPGWNLVGKGAPGSEEYTNAEWLEWFNQYQAQMAQSGANAANEPQRVFNNTLLQNQQAMVQHQQQIANQMAQQQALAQSQQQLAQDQLAQQQLSQQQLSQQPPPLQQVQPPYQPPPRKLDTPVLPNPEEYLQYQRSVAEFRHESKHHDEYAIVKALKDALPSDLLTIANQQFSVDEMKVAGVVDKFLDWIKKRFSPLHGVESLDILRDWHGFRRQGASLKKYIDDFEQMQVRLTRIGKQTAAAELRDTFLIKAFLPVQLEKDIILALSRQIKANGATEWTLEDLQAEFLLQDGKAELLQRRDVNLVDARPAMYDSDTLGLNSGIPCKHFGNPYGGCLRGRDCKYSHSQPPTRQSSSRLYPSRSPWIDYLQQAYPHTDPANQYDDRRHPNSEFAEYTPSQWDAAARGVHERQRQKRDVNYGSTSRGRSTSPRSTSPRFDRYSRSRSPRSGKGKGKGKGNLPCFDFQKGICRRGTECRFSHSAGDSSRSPSRGYSRQPERDHFSGAKWKREICRDYSRGTCRYGDSCRHVHGDGRTPSPRRTNFSPRPRFGSRSPGRSPNGSTQRGDASRSPRPPPRRV